MHFFKANPTLKKIAFSTTLFSSAAWGAQYTVTTSADSGPGSIRAVMNTINAQPSNSGFDTIFLVPAGNLITLTSGSLPPINLPSGNTLTVDGLAGALVTIDGNATSQAFFLNSGKLVLTGLTLQNCKATGANGGDGSATGGGGGGGGGLAAGGALFVNNGTSANVFDVIFNNNTVIGGNGGNGTIFAPNGFGGGGAGAFGGGAGGAGNASGGGGGGGGFPVGGAGGAGGAAGANGTGVGGGGGGGAGAAGGTGAIAGNNGGAGGQSGSGSGGGGGSTALAGAGGPTGGGSGGGGGASEIPSGGFGAGGGGGGTSGGSGSPGGAAGIGAGGGGGGVNAAGGTSPFSATSGGAGDVSGAGGGGAGLGFGGAIFVHESGNLTIGSGVSFSGNFANSGTGGSGANSGDSPGFGYGDELFMTTGANVLIDTDTNLTFPNFVASEMAATGITGGGIIKRGTGTLSLNAENSFLYVLNVQEGTVQLLPGSSVNALAQLNGGNVTVAVEASFLGGIEGNSDSTLTLTAAGNAVCTVDLGVVRELASLIQGAGGTLQKEGAGELQLTRTASANTYDGGTTIAAGVLAAVRDEALGPQTAALTYGLSSGDLPVYKFLDSYSSGRTWTLLADQSTVDTNGFTADIAGGTSGGGGLVVTGGGVATVSSHLMHTGVTKVGDATLAIKPNASIARGVDVTSAGTLKGTGTIGGDVVNAGVTRPGLSIGTLPIVGNYTESGTLTIELDPTSTSVLAIGGNMTINPGSTLLVSPDLGVGVYAPSKTYTVVTIGGTRTGTYSTVTTTFPNRFSAQALYNSIDILLNVLPFSNTIKGGNEGAVAKCVDAYPVTTDSDFIKVDDALTMLSNDVSALRSAFNKLQPSQFGALALVQENNDILLRNAITHRLSEVYPLTCDEEWINGHKGSLWVEGMGKYVEQDHQQKNHGFHAETGGVAMGADGRIAKKTYLGAAFGYTGTYLDWTASAGEAHINSYYGSLYGTWYNRHVFVDAAFIGGFNQYEEDRKIHFPGIKRTATSDHDGYQLAGSLGTGLLFTPSKWQIQPFVRADYVYLHQNGFTENGAKSLDLKVHDMHSNYVRTDLGLKLERCFDFIHTKVIPDLKLSWIWENQLDDAHIKSSFKGQSCSFTVTGMHPTHNLFAPAIGVMVMNLGGGMTSSIHYEAEIGKNVWENRLYLHFGWNY